jgi:hypothetical protein
LLLPDFVVVSFYPSSTHWTALSQYDTVDNIDKSGILDREVYPECHGIMNVICISFICKRSLWKGDKTIYSEIGLAME